MTLPRERATNKADLPHAYEGEISLAECDVCGEAVLDARHLAWERAHEQATPASSLPRETGV